MEKRFWSKVKKTDYCWNWIASEAGNHYGGFKFRGQTTKANRVSWILHFGEIPKGMCILHKCDNKKCVNPDHLFLGTFADNNLDMMKKGRWKRYAPMWNKGKKTGPLSEAHRIAISVGHRGQVPWNKGLKLSTI